MTFHTSYIFSVSIHLISLSVPDIDENWSTPKTLLLQDIYTFCSLCLGCLYPKYSHLFPFLQGFYSNINFSLRSSLTLCKIIPIYNTFYVLSLLYFSPYYWLPNVEHILLIYLLYYLLLSLEHKLIECRYVCFIHCYMPWS